MGSSELEKLSAILVSLQSKVQCPICLKNIEQTVELNCQHRFCEDCVLQLKKKKELVCPICKTQMKKRTPIFKDCFADEFGKFVNNLSIIINEKYGHSANEVNSGNLNLMKIASPDCENVALISKDNFSLPNRMRLHKENEANPSNMELSDITRNKVISWLKKVPSKSDVLTPSPPCEEDFQMPSISQVAPVSTKAYKDSRQRSQSLTIHNNLPTSLLKRYQSLAEGLNDDYNIEEIQSETLVKQVERKVIQDILEDECLANFEQAAESLNRGAKIAPLKRKQSDKIASSENMSNACSYSGWERIENNNTSNIAPRQIKKRRKISPKKGESSGGLQHPAKAESFQVPKETCQNERNPTPPHIINQNETVICHIPPISTELDDLNLVAIQLHNNLKSCLSEIRVEREELDLTFSMDNFTNLLSYAEKLVHLLPKETNSSNSKPAVNQENAATQTLLPTVRSIANQVDFQEDRKSVLNKRVQTLTIDSHSVEIQADDLPNISNSVQWDRHVQSMGIKSENGEELREGKMKDSNDQSLMRRVHVKPSQAKISSNTSLGSNGLLISSKKSKKNKSSEPIHNTSQESAMISSLSSINKSGHKISRKLTYPHTDQVKKFKRIREPTSDSELEEEEQPNKRRLIRDDLTVEFADSENIEANSGNKDPPVTSSSEKMDYDQYLLDAMLKYDPGPITKSVVIENKISPKTHIDEDKQLKSGEAQIDTLKRTSKPTRKTQKSGSTVATSSFTPCDALDNYFDKFDKGIMEYQQTSPFNTEFEMVENTPYPEVTRFPSKKSVIPIPLNGRSQIISKGSASTSSSKKKHEMLPDENILNVSNKSLCSLNRNINIQSYYKIVTDDVQDLLKDLHNNDDFFGGITESGSVGEEVAKTGSHKTRSCFSNNIGNVMENIKDFENDEDIENQLKNISFPDEQLKQDQLNVAQTMTSNKMNKSKTILEEVIESSDVSDDEIIETTPQKNKVSSSQQRLILRSLNDADNFEVINKELDFCLPPPPGFDDDNSTFPGDDLGANQENTKENCPIPALCDPSLTPNRLSDLIVNSEDMRIGLGKMSTQESFIFGASVFSQKRKCDTFTPKRTRKILEESQSRYAPIAKSSIRQSQTKYSPLVSTSKPAKKTSLMTSTPNQKSILNFVVSQQSASPSQKTRPCIMWSRILDRDLNVFTQLECRKLLTTSKVFTPQVTHVVVLVDESGRIVSHTAKILQAIAAGIWVVRYEWAEKCLLMKQIVPEEPYEALDTTGEPGPRTSRLISKSQPLFVGYRFYLAPPLRGVSKQDLEYAIRLAGGEIVAEINAFLKNRNKIDVIVTEISATEDIDRFEGWLENFKIVTVDVEWLSSCIGQYKIVSCRPFLAAGDESVICNLGYPDALMESVPFTLTEAD